MLNFVAVLLVQFFVFGPWKDPKSANFPQSPAFVAAAKLPSFGAERIHAGLIFALVAVVVLFFVLCLTRRGFEMRAMGGNPEAARRAGIRFGSYIVLALLVGSAFAEIAGFGEVSAIQGRLRPEISPGYGFIGFLVSWLAGHNSLLEVFRGPIVDNTGKVRVPEGQIANFAELLNTTDWLVKGASGQISYFLAGRWLTYLWS